MQGLATRDAKACFAQEPIDSRSDCVQIIALKQVLCAFVKITRPNHGPFGMLPVVKASVDEGRPFCFKCFPKPYLRQLLYLPLAKGCFLVQHGEQPICDNVETARTEDGGRPRFGSQREHELDPPDQFDEMERDSPSP